MSIIVDGIVDAIKELKEKAKCPFCDKQLELDSAQRDYFGGNRFILICNVCKLSFRITKMVHKKEVKWQLDEVRRSPS